MNNRGSYIKPLVVHKPGRSGKLPYMIKNFFYRKKTKMKGVPRIQMQSMEIYTFEKPVDTIFPKKETVSEVKTAFLTAFHEKKDFETDGEMFHYNFGDTNIKIEDKQIEKLKIYPNSNDFVSTHLINQYSLPQILRFAYSCIYHTLDLEMYKMTNDQINTVIKDKVTEKEIETVKGQLDHEAINRNMGKIKEAFEKMFQNLDLEAIEEISKIIDIKNKYTKTDNFVSIAKQMNWASVNQDPSIQYTYYTTSSKYWRPIMPALSNYDPREIIIAMTLIKRYSTIALEIVEKGITINELYMFLISVMETQQFQDCTMVKYLHNNGTYAVIF